jgi:hypothetical protein
MMTNRELVIKLEQAQTLLSEIYHWASTPLSGSPLQTNADIANLMSTADSCILDAIDILDGYTDY